MNLLIDEDEEWDDVYKKYSLEEIPWHSDNPDPALVSLLRKKKKKLGIALDVCSGAGSNTIFLAKKGFKVTAIDISSTAIEIAKKRAEKMGVAQNCKFLSGNVLKMSLPKNTFDFVFDRGCYHHIPNSEKPHFARIVSDSLKQRGQYYLICFSDKNPPWKQNVSKEEIIKNFSPYFNIEEINIVPTIEKTGRKINFYHSRMTKN